MAVAAQLLHRRVVAAHKDKVERAHGYEEDKHRAAHLVRGRGRVGVGVRVRARVSRV